MSLVLNPQIFAGRLSRDAMHGWCALLRRGHEDLVVGLGRYPVTFVGRGHMRMELEFPPNFHGIDDCYGVCIFSRKGAKLHEFRVEGHIPKDARAILWMP